MFAKYYKVPLYYMPLYFYFIFYFEVKLQIFK